MNHTYRDFTEYLRKRFPTFKVQKISLNAGFTCPNRDGEKGFGGCTYCNNQTFTPGYCSQTASIAEQLHKGIAFFKRKYPEMKYIAYFQAYTNTYSDIEELRQKYEEALNVGGVVGLIIGTRPDCVSDELLNYLSGLSKQTFVMIEYGIESTLNETLKRINRGHTYEESENAIRRTAERDIPVGAHLILGLPGETRKQILQHADKLSSLPLTSVKLHQLQIIRNTAMGKEYEAHPGHFKIYTVEEYANLVAAFLNRIRKEVYIDRFISQSPEEMLIAPRWGLKNHEFKAILERELGIIT